MVTARTPGEWYVHELSSRVPFPFEVRASAGTAYRTVGFLRSLTFDRADAHLISAAPDLLSALKAELDTHGHLSGRCAVPAGADGCTARCEVVRAAVAKAEGRTDGV